MMNKGKKLDNSGKESKHDKLGVNRKSGNSGLFDFGKASMGGKGLEGSKPKLSGKMC